MRNHHRPWFRGEPPSFADSREVTSDLESVASYAHWRCAPSDPYEDAARAMEMLRRPTPEPDEWCHPDWARKQAAAFVEAEREHCARLADATALRCLDYAGKERDARIAREIAQSIRARKVTVVR